MKLALEEWRQWLEGAERQFLAITDPRNLEYLQNAQRLNPHQARWALFFSRFDFKVIQETRTLKRFSAFTLQTYPISLL